MYEFFLGCQILIWAIFSDFNACAMRCVILKYNTYFNSKITTFVDNNLTWSLVSGSDFLRKVSKWYKLLHTIVFFQCQIFWLQMRSTTFNITYKHILKWKHFDTWLNNINCYMYIAHLQWRYPWYSVIYWMLLLFSLYL